jgi:hypothetical protein
MMSVERLVEEIRFRLKETLKLDARTVAYIYEKEREDRRFEVVAVEGGEFFMRIGPVECVEKTEEGCYVEMGLTTAEAIALALKLIRYASKAYEKESA